MHLIRKLKRMGGLLASGDLKAVKDKIFYEIKSRMTYSRLLKKYSKDRGNVHAVIRDCR